MSQMFADVIQITQQLQGDCMKDVEFAVNSNLQTSGNGYISPNSLCGGLDKNILYPTLKFSFVCTGVNPFLKLRARAKNSLSEISVSSRSLNR